MAKQQAPITIAINTLFLIPNQVGGTEYHLRSFLAALETTDTNNNYIVFCNRENADTFTFDSPRWQKVVCPVNATNRLQRILYEQLFFPQLIGQFQCQLIHSFGYWGILTSRIPQIVTVHDANWLDQPEDMTLITRLVTKLLTELSLKKANRILTDSQFSLERLAHYFPHFRKKIVVIEPGIDKQLTQLFTSSFPRPKTNFILSVSAFYPHKNVEYLIKLWPHINKLHPDLKLIIVGDRGKNAQKISQLLQQLPNCHHYAKVSLKRLAELYQTASLFVFPSTYEGFGYPVYEALAAGQHVVVGRKELYSHRVQDNLNVLTGELKKDVDLMHSLLLRQTRKKIRSQLIKDYSYPAASRQLINVYISTFKNK